VERNKPELEALLEVLHEYRVDYVVTGAPRAITLQMGTMSILVEAVSDLLATLTLPRREKDVDRVRRLRRIQRHRPT
jgi:hypothetical protein